MPKPGEDRRRYGRIDLDQALNATFGPTPSKVLEVSVTGFLIAHEGRLTVGDVHPLRLEWEGKWMELRCHLVRSTLWRLARKMGEQSVYHSGLKIVESSRESFDHLRELIGERILRALEEQKANAHGIPPLAAYMYQPQKGDLYRRCELVNGTWRKTETIRPQQPLNGFTVSAEVDPWHVDLLCETWQSTTEEGRRLTRLFAELSISKNEGVPTRRYEP
jgi:hypothetical protein